MSIFIGGFTGVITDPTISTITVDNGLTKTGNNIQLSGTLLKDTSINLATFFLRLRDGDFTLESCKLILNSSNCEINSNTNIDLKTLTLFFSTGKIRMDDSDIEFAGQSQCQLGNKGLRSVNGTELTLINLDVGTVTALTPDTLRLNLNGTDWNIPAKKV